MTPGLWIALGFGLGTLWGTLITTHVIIPQITRDRER